MKVVFMGTPIFAAGALKGLISGGHDICAVVTGQDKPQGRKQILTPSPVKTLALEHDIPVLQPRSLRENPELAAELKAFEADVFVVAAYGKILPKEVLCMPPLGCVNIHASLLPAYRGASPIHAALLGGDEKTGVTTMLMDEGLDTGAMLERAETAISDDDDFFALHDRLMDMGAVVINTTLDGLKLKTLTPIAQPNEFTYAPIITKNMAKLDFTCPEFELWGKVRAFALWPVAFFEMGGKKYKVHKAAPAEMAGLPGTVLRSSGELVIACGEGALNILEIQPENGKKMSADSYLRGHNIPEGMNINEI